MADIDPTDTEGNERLLAKRREDEKRAEQVEIDDLKWLMGGKRGRRVMWRLLSTAGVFRTVFNTNAMTMAFNEGQRNAGLRLLVLIMQHCPERYTEMTTEVNDE